MPGDRRKDQTMTTRCKVYGTLGGAIGTWTAYGMTEEVTTAIAFCFISAFVAVLEGMLIDVVTTRRDGVTMSSIYPEKKEQSDGRLFRERV
jgi:hypothetical protein